MKTGLRLFCLVALVAISLTFIPPVTAQDTISIEYWNINNKNFGGAQVDAFIADFQSLNTGLKVEARVQESYPALVQNLQTAIAAKTPPDVVQIGYPYLNYVANNLPFVPVKDLVTKYRNDAYLKQFPENILGIPVIDGVQVGMAYSLSNPVVYYNADMFRKAGLDPDVPPQTWADWMKIAPKLKEATGKPVFNFGYNDDNWMLQAWIESNGGRMLVCKDGIARTGIDSPEAAKGLQTWADAISQGLSINANYNDGTAAFLAQEVATFTYTIAGRANLQSQAKFDLRATTFPSFGSNPVRIPGGGNVLVVFATDAKRQEAAWKFVQYLTSPKGFSEWTKSTGYVPLIPSVLDDSQYLKDFIAKNPIQKIGVDQLKYVVTWTSFPGPDGLAVGKVLYEATQLALSGKLSAADALKDAATKVNGLIDGQKCSAG